MSTPQKRCTRCHKEKDRQLEFYQWKGNPKGECKDCTKDLATKRQKTVGRYPAQPITRRKRYLGQKENSFDGRTEASFRQKFSRHGLTLDQYHAMAEKQDFLCAICEEEPQPQNNRRGNVDNFVVDHNHITNKTRALLCWPCNAALGHLRDNPKIARRAAAYLEHHSSPPPSHSPAAAY